LCIFALLPRLNRRCIRSQLNLRSKRFRMQRLDRCFLLRDVGLSPDTHLQPQQKSELSVKLEKPKSTSRVTEWELMEREVNKLKRARASFCAAFGHQKRICCFTLKLLCKLCVFCEDATLQGLETMTNVKNNGQGNKASQGYAPDCKGRRDCRVDAFYRFPQV